MITTQPKDYRKKQSKLFPIEKIVLREYPAVLKKLSTRAEDYNAVLDEIEQDEDNGQCFAIRPPYPLNIGTVESNKSEIKRVYEIGRKRQKKFCQI